MISTQGGQECHFKGSKTGPIVAYYYTKWDLKKISIFFQVEECCISLEG